MKRSFEILEESLRGTHIPMNMCTPTKRYCHHRNSTNTPTSRLSANSQSQSLHQKATSTPFDDATCPAPSKNFPCSSEPGR